MQRYARFSHFPCCVLSDFQKEFSLEKKKKKSFKNGSSKDYELQESENCLRNCKQRVVISGKYLEIPWKQTE